MFREISCTYWEPKAVRLGVVASDTGRGKKEEMLALAAIGARPEATSRTEMRMVERMGDMNLSRKESAYGFGGTSPRFRGWGVPAA
jgi:hypothetical protein